MVVASYTYPNKDVAYMEKGKAFLPFLEKTVKKHTQTSFFFLACVSEPPNQCMKTPFPNLKLFPLENGQVANSPDMVLKILYVTEHYAC